MPFGNALTFRSETSIEIEAKATDFEQAERMLEFLLGEVRKRRSIVHTLGWSGGGSAGYKTTGFPLCECAQVVDRAGESCAGCQRRVAAEASSSGAALAKAGEGGSG